MRKRFVALMTTGLVLTASSAAFAAPGDGTTVIPPTSYTPSGHAGADKDYRYWEEGTAATSGSYGSSIPGSPYNLSTPTATVPGTARTRPASMVTTTTMPRTM